LLATEPLTLDEPWQALRTGEFVVVVDGQVVWQALDPDTRAFPVALPISEQREPSPAG
jgi:glutamine amidotransferase